MKHLLSSRAAVVGCIGCSLPEGGGRVARDGSPSGCPGLSPRCTRLLHALSKALVSGSEMMTLDFARFGSQSRMTTHTITVALGKELQEQRRDM